MSITKGGLPHARGGVSKLCALYIDAWKSSPRPWGCFQQLFDQQQEQMVFPTPVGVFLEERPQHEGSVGLPHARGGVSI